MSIKYRGTFAWNIDIPILSLFNTRLAAFLANVFVQPAEHVAKLQGGP